jgi:hypothetical protein
MSWAADLFAIVDSGTPAEMASRMSPGGTLTFGNAEPVSGRESIQEVSAGFRASIVSLEHEILRAWRVDDTVMTELSVTYHRHDGQRVTVPCANIFDLDRDGLITSYQIFMDVNPVFA